MAPIQVIVIPILKKGADVEALKEVARKLAQIALEAGIKSKVDDDETKSPGFKYNVWEQKVDLVLPLKNLELCYFNLIKHIQCILHQ